MMNRSQFAGTQMPGIKVLGKRMHGFSMVELLVAMVVGLIIVGGAFSLHSNTRDTQMSNEMQMAMVADARFAVEMISYDLRHAGMWGGTNKTALVQCKSTDPTCTKTSSGDTPPTNGIATNDCAPGWYFDLTSYVFATDNTDPNPYSATCIPASEKQVSSTDILVVRYADSNLPMGLKANQIYVRSNNMSGRLFVGATQPVLSAYDTAVITNNHALRAHAYYVSAFTDAAGDNIPSLRRVALVGGPEMQNQTLISGVEDFQVQFGVDVNADTIIDRYVDPNEVANWADVYAAKIWLLMRSEKKQIGLNTKKSFSIAGAAAKNYGGKDNYRYFLVTSVVNLRNVR